MTLMLAPMEGLLDAPLRDVLTRLAPYERCVSEFIRVTGTLLPPRVFSRVVPELLSGGCTPAGVPVRPQLLGSDAVCLAENAAALAELSPTGVDLNFGCPAKVVNRHGGGAMLLDSPEQVHRIVAAVRRAVPRALPVSAKMRLGLRDTSRTLDNARAIAEAGASELVVHARTRDDGYRPPAHWSQIAAIREAVRLPVIANGEIWTLADAQRCRAESGCDALMLGRGAVADPGLALALSTGEAEGLPWAAVAPRLHDYWQLVSARVVPRHRPGRIKQWLHYLRRRHHEAQVLYDDLRIENDPRMIEPRLAALAGAGQGV